MAFLLDSDEGEAIQPGVRLEIQAMTSEEFPPRKQAILSCRWGHGPNCKQRKNCLTFGPWPKRQAKYIKKNKKIRAWMLEIRVKNVAATSSAFEYDGKPE